MHVEKVTNYAIAKMLFIRHIYINGFIISNVLNVDFLIYPYNDRFTPMIAWVSHYGINIGFNTAQYFKNQD